MYKHILVPTDGSKLSARAVHAAAGLARALDARLSALYVLAPYTPPLYSDGLVYVAADIGPARHKQLMQKAARKALADAAAIARRAGVDCAGLSATHNRPWEAILQAARAKRCDLVAMASHGRRGLAGLLLGSETTKVLTHSKIPVLVCR